MKAAEVPTRRRVKTPNWRPGSGKGLSGDEIPSVSNMEVLSSAPSLASSVISRPSTADHIQPDSPSTGNVRRRPGSHEKPRVVRSVSGSVARRAPPQGDIQSMSLSELAAAGRAGRPGSQSMVSPGFASSFSSQPLAATSKVFPGNPTTGHEDHASTLSEQAGALSLRQGQAGAALDAAPAVRTLATPAHDRYGNALPDASHHRYGSSSEADSVASTPRSVAESGSHGGRPPPAGLAAEAPEMRMSRDNPMLTPVPSVSSSLQLTSSTDGAGSSAWNSVTPTSLAGPAAEDTKGAALQGSMLAADALPRPDMSPRTSSSAETPPPAAAAPRAGGPRGDAGNSGAADWEGPAGPTAAGGAAGVAGAVHSFDGDAVDRDDVVRAEADDGVHIDPNLPAAMRRALHQALDVIQRAEELERTIAIPDSDDDDNDNDDEDDEERAARKRAAKAEQASVTVSDRPSESFSRSTPLSAEESSVAAVAAAAAYIRKGKGKMVDVGESSVLMSSVDSMAGEAGPPLTVVDSFASFGDGAGPSSSSSEPPLGASASSGAFSLSLGPVDAGASFDSDVGGRGAGDALGGAFGQLDDVTRALLAAEQNQEIRRRELAKYMEALQSLRDDDGEEVVEFPADFEQQIWALAGREREDRSAATTAEPAEEEVVFYKPDGARDTEKEEGIKKIRKLDRILAQKMKKALAVAREVYPDKYARLAEKAAAAAEQALREERKQAKLEARLQRIMEGVDAAKPPAELSILERNKMMGANARYFMLQPEEEALVERLLASPDVEDAQGSGDAAEVPVTRGATGFEVAGDDRRRIEEIEARLARFQLAHATDTDTTTFTPRPGSSADSTAAGGQGAGDGAGGNTDRTGTAGSSVRGDRRPPSAPWSTGGPPAPITGGKEGRGSSREKAARGAVGARGGRATGGCGCGGCMAAIMRVG